VRLFTDGNMVMYGNQWQQHASTVSCNSRIAFRVPVSQYANQYSPIVVDDKKEKNKNKNNLN